MEKQGQEFFDTGSIKRTLNIWKLFQKVLNILLADSLLQSDNVTFLGCFMADGHYYYY